MRVEIRIKKKFGDFELNVDLSSNSSRIGILGASGCGKSMTLKSAAGIETPDEGYIAIDGRVLYDSENKINLKPQKRNVGYLFQNYALFPTMTVLDNIKAGLKGTKAENEKRAQEMVDKFQIRGLENHLPGQLSGGQQQRVALARIMAYEPDVILLDEPFSALDVYLKDRLQQELRDLLADYEGIVIMVSHSRDEIYNFADELLVMEHGRDVICGKTKEVFEEPQFVSAAILTGCKNVSSAKRIDTHTVYCNDWDLTLHLNREVPEEIGAVGIRAHYFEPCTDCPQENYFAFENYSIAEYPFETHYYIPTGNGSISYFVPKEMEQKFKEEGFPKYLRLGEKAIMLLKNR